MNEGSAVAILLSTYNGEIYVGDQIQSIIDQSFGNWKLLIRDDGSNDATLDIVRQYCVQDERISLISDGFGNVGPADSFALLLDQVDTPYFMFSDQDDVWLSHKIALTLSHFTDELKPQAVFTDLLVVDESLLQYSPSFMQLSRFDPRRGIELRREIIQNIVVGCTMAGNRELLNMSALNRAEVRRNVVMHDWWLAMVATCFGRLTYEPECTMLYRQHGKNVLGAKESGFINYFRLLKQGKPWLRAQDFLRRVISQAECFQETYSSDLNSEQREIISCVIGVRKGPIALKLIIAYFKGIRMHTFDRNLALWLSFAGGRNSTVFF